MSIIRKYLSRIVCFFLGHMIVDRNATWWMSRMLLSKNTEAVCIRCYKPINFMADLADSVFSESPIFREMKKRAEPTETPHRS